jgi:hypothetical protein
MRKIASLLTISLLVISNASIAANVQPYPSPVQDIDHSGTGTGSAVVVLKDGGQQTPRINCLLQNNGSHNMYYLFGGGVATTSNRVLIPGMIMYCSDGITVSTSQLSLLATSGDSYSLTESFLIGP